MWSEDRKSQSWTLREVIRVGWWEWAQGRRPFLSRECPPEALLPWMVLCAGGGAGGVVPGRREATSPQEDCGGGFVFVAALTCAFSFLVRGC